MKGLNITTYYIHEEMSRKSRLLKVIPLIGFLATLHLLISSDSFSSYTGSPSKNTHFIERVELKEIDPLSTKCHEFFNHYSQHPISYEYSDYVFEHSLENYLGQQIKKFPNHSKQQLQSWKNDYVDHRNSYFEVEQNLKNQTIDTRIFGTCFLKPDHITDNNQCDYIQRKLFPWMTQRSPLLVNYDGTTFEYPESDCFIQGVYKYAKGQGIVLSAKNSHYQQLVSLILTLRILGNTLPLQIVHRGDLSKSRQLQLTRLARIDFSRLLTEKHEVVKMLLDHQENFKDTNFKSSQYPKIEISYLNIQNTVTKPYLKQFKSYSNKLLAALFTTFKEVIIMDADIILYKSPQSLFDYIEEYKRTGAFFFKDRELINRSSKEDARFWKSLMPTERESQFFPSIQQVTDHSISNRYFDGFTHLVEAGIVLMDRSTHFPGLLISMQLTLWRTATKRVWGDKELFWLSQAISGTESFEFNKYPSGAVGEIIHPDVKNNEQVKICSNQPVHVYNDSVLWINSGFKYCKNGAASKDLKHFPGYDMPKLTDLYKGPINVSAVVIPPIVDDYYLSWSKEMEQKDLHERTQGWYNEAMCQGYTYCAVSPVTIRGKKRYGKVLEFSKEQTRDYNYLGNVWLDANTLQRDLEKRKSTLMDYLDVSTK